MNYLPGDIIEFNYENLYRGWHKTIGQIKIVLSSSAEVYKVLVLIEKDKPLVNQPGYIHEDGSRYATVHSKNIIKLIAEEEIPPSFLIEVLKKELE